MYEQSQLSVKNKKFLGIDIAERYSYVWSGESNGDSDLKCITFTARCQNLWASPLEMKAFGLGD